jgi:hypothetical protein
VPAGAFTCNNCGVAIETPTEGAVVCGCGYHNLRPGVIDIPLEKLGGVMVDAPSTDDSAVVVEVLEGSFEASLAESLRVVVQSNNYQTTFSLSQQGDAVTGTASALNLLSGNVDETGLVSGAVSGVTVLFTTNWTGSSGGTFTSDYSFAIDTNGALISGVTGSSTFTSSQIFQCN